MIYLLWSLLNLAMLVWFLLIAFSALKLILKNMGMASTIIFVIGIFSFTQGNVTNKQDPAGNVGEGKAVGTVNLTNSLSFNLNLLFVYPRGSAGQSELPGKVLMSGMVIGHEWRPGLTRVNLKEGVTHYSITGDHQWKLLGLVLYNQEQKFQGALKAK